MAAPGPVPVTLLTGFLGSGKTTLLNRLVDAPQAGRVAVIVNEAGEVALEALGLDLPLEEVYAGVEEAWAREAAAEASALAGG